MPVLKSEQFTAAISLITGAELRLRKTAGKPFRSGDVVFDLKTVQPLQVFSPPSVRMKGLNTAEMEAVPHLCQAFRKPPDNDADAGFRYEMLSYPQQMV